MQGEKKLIIIDGYGFLFRAYFSMPPLTTPEGAPIGAIYGFCSMLLRVMNEMQYTHIVVALDSGAKTFRNEIYPEYKANRAAAPDDLIPQFPEIRRAIESFNIVALEQIGFEADDIIATLTKRARAEDYDVTIISTDKDLMQLIDSNVKMFDGLKNKNIGENEVFEKFGVKPNQVRDVLSLMGDSSDNIPGVKGIGPKGAAELINQFGDFKNLMSSLDKVQKPRLKLTLEENIKLAELSYELVTLVENIEIPIKIDDLKAKIPSRKIVTEFFNELGFKTLLARVKFHTDDNLQESKLSSESIVEIANLSQLNDLILNINKNGKVAIYASSQNQEQISIAYDESISYSLKISEEPDLFGSNKEISFADVREKLILIMENESILKIIYNLKYLAHFVFDQNPESNCKIESYDDVMLMSYVLDNGRFEHDVDSLCRNHLNVEKFDFKASRLIALHNLLKSRLLTEKVLNLYKTIENPLSMVLYRLEKAGIKISVSGLEKLGGYFEQNIAQLEMKIFAIAGYELNLGSPKQLSELLFDRMGLESRDKTQKTKSNSTGAEVLEELATAGNEIATLILKWRQYSKLNNTYTLNLTKFADKNERIHTNFRMCTTSTGRLSSVEPNLQNIPTRTEEGMKIRSNFIADNGCVLISADYSQIELRLLASIANVKSLIDAFKNNIDIHSKTASEIFNISLDQVNSEYRRKAKAINFGIIYGISSFGLANNLGIAKSEAKEFIELYFQRYPEIKQYMENTVELARKNGFVETIFGRKCFLSGINDKNFNIRNFSERAAINAPIQGSQADIIKKAMIKIDDKIQSLNLSSRVILQIHDELIIEAPINEREKIAEIVKLEMESVTKLQVPTTVDVSFGSNWDEL